MFRNLQAIFKGSSALETYRLSVLLALLLCQRSCRHHSSRLHEWHRAIPFRGWTCSLSCASWWSVFLLQALYPQPGMSKDEPFCWMLVISVFNNTPTFAVVVDFSRQGTPTLLDEVCDCRPRLSLLVWQCEVMKSEFSKVRQLPHHTRGHKGLTALASYK